MESKMKFMGSKNRISKYILPIMLKHRAKDQWWVEPFVGGGNMIDKVDGNRLGSDIDPHVISALVSIRGYTDYLPKNNKEFTEADYKMLRLNNDYPHKGYAGFAFSYGGKWLGGWRRDGLGKRDYVAEAYRNAKKQSTKLKGVMLVHGSYKEINLPPNSIIYCDPPYQGTTKYKDGFNHDAFWEWCRLKAKEGHTVFVSEYAAPEDFSCVWEKSIVSSLTQNTGAKSGTERLFMHAP